MQEAYHFQWEDLGDLAEGRPHLGLETSVMAYRLMQFTFKDVLAAELGDVKTRELFKKAGLLAGKEFCQNLLDISAPFSEFIALLKNLLIRHKIGILRIEESDEANLEFTLTISEDLDCSGLPLYGETVCDYDEGFIAGILEAYTGKRFSAREIDCWATGDRTCRFQVKPIGE